MNKEEIIMNKILEMENEIKNLKEELNKQEEPKTNRRWKPEEGDKYYYVEFYGKVDVRPWSDSLFDCGAYCIGNVFKTREEAEFEIEKLKVLAELKEYADDDKEWNKGNTHWCIKYDTDDRYMYADAYDYIMQVPSKFYFSSNLQAQKAIKAIGEERLKKYYFCVEE